MQTTANLLTAAHVRRRFGNISDMSLWRWLNDSEMHFPQPIVIQKRRYWNEAELAAWQSERIAKRNSSTREAA